MFEEKDRSVFDLPTADTETGSKELSEQHQDEFAANKNAKLTPTQEFSDWTSKGFLAG